MSKSKHTKSNYERYDDYVEYDNWGSDPEERRRKNIQKRMKRALRTRNIDDLMELDEEEYD